MSDSSNRQTTGKTARVSALLLAIPPALALAAAAFPAYVPIPFATVDDPSSARPILLAIGLGLLLINALFFVGVRHLLDQG